MLNHLLVIEDRRARHVFFPEALEPRFRLVRFQRFADESEHRLDVRDTFFDGFETGIRRQLGPIQRADHPLIAVVSGDGSRTLGMAARPSVGFVSNLGKGMRCIHSNPLLGDVPPGATVEARALLPFVNGAFAVWTMFLMRGLGRGSTRSRKWVIRLQLGWIALAAIDLLLAYFLADRGLEPVPLITRMLIPTLLIYLLRRPSVRAGFGITP